MTELSACIWIVHVWKDNFALRFSKLKINIRINKHGLYEAKTASPGIRSNILRSWQISFDMKKIRFSRQKEIVCDIFFLLSICFKNIQVAVKETYEKRPCEKQLGLISIYRAKTFFYFFTGFLRS